MNVALGPVYRGFAALGSARDYVFGRRVWDGPEYLPTMAEIRRPELWLERIDYQDGRMPAMPATVAAR